MMIRTIRTMLIVLTLVGLITSPAALASEATPSAEGGFPACAAGARDDRAEDSPELAEWQTLSLTNARTGEVFAISDFLGCAVLVEPMATWCINCLMQMGNIAEALPELDPDRHVVIAISVETDLPPEDLAAYADNSELDWIFTVASPDMLKAIVDAFGREAIVPPSTPHVIVNPDGSTGDLRTGIEEPEAIVDLMNEASGT